MSEQDIRASAVAAALAMCKGDTAEAAARLGIPQEELLRLLLAGRPRQQPRVDAGAHREEGREMATEYIGLTGVAKVLDVKRETLAVWLVRYDNWPEPDALFEPFTGDPDRGWLREREDDWRRWMREGRPGQGARGGVELPAAAPAPGGTVRYLSIGGVAHRLGVSAGTASGWLRRYDNWPQPDAVLLPGRRGIPDQGWLPERVRDWRKWMGQDRPGRGAGGGRPPQNVARLV